jgi:hypothetical protein
MLFLKRSATSRPPNSVNFFISGHGVPIAKTDTNRLYEIGPPSQSMPPVRDCKGKYQSQASSATKESMTKYKIKKAAG